MTDQSKKLTPAEEAELKRLNDYLATREDVGIPLPENRKIEGLDDEVVRAAEELGLL